MHSPEDIRGLYTARAGTSVRPWYAQFHPEVLSDEHQQLGCMTMVVIHTMSVAVIEKGKEEFGRDQLPANHEFEQASFQQVALIVDLNDIGVGGLSHADDFYRRAGHRLMDFFDVVESYSIHRLDLYGCALAKRGNDPHC